MPAGPDPMTATLSLRSPRKGWGHPSRSGTKLQVNASSWLIFTGVSISDRTQASSQSWPAGQTRLQTSPNGVSYTHLRAHETRHLVCRLLLEKKKNKKTK